jgi:hypothetical protein
LIKKKHIAVIRKEIFHWQSRLDQEKTYCHYQKRMKRQHWQQMSISVMKGKNFIIKECLETKKKHTFGQ